MEYIKSAFEAVCKEAKPAVGKHVSLYVKQPYYGGPEEGGWWGEDVCLVSSQWFPTEQQAEEAAERVKKLAEELNKEERKKFGEQCLRESAWLEERGLDDSFLGEPDGEEEYYVEVEDYAGSCAQAGSRQYC